MFLETTVAARFPAILRNNKRVVHIDSSCKLHPYNSNCAHHMLWERCQKSSGIRFRRMNKLVPVKNSIHASTEYLGSAPDPIKKNVKSSYHPFEEFAQPENSGDARPTSAETSRTIIEVNSKATLNGEDILKSLTSEENYVQVIVGVDTMEMISEMDLSSPSEINFGIEEIGDEDVDDYDEEDEDDDEDDDDDFDVGWVSILSDDEQDDSDEETLADWAKLETMRFSHPMHFAKTLAEIASDDPIDWMEQPPACLAIQGLIRPAFIEEHSMIQKHLSATQTSNTDISEWIKSKGENVDAVNDHVHNLRPPKDDAAQMRKNDSGDIPVNETAFYKLEMTKIQLYTAHGVPTLLEVEDYMKAQPDAIAHSASKIISRLKDSGEKAEQALKSLCWRCKAIQVEEAQLICVDSLGFDVRVCSGTQVQTLRFAFKKRATSEYSAERQLNDILFPGSHQKPQKLTQTHQNEC
ncbi:hypothetical protein PIB30_059704 [Stylosanthes scabra]|uniref:Uncharacterized protein n=1 Tax=Stylosanthes scabra TaxID=79078 RepID=A0ABU6VJA4_9FABA|nr:hypothetical protein [Stylosanthes scabra]